MTFVPLPGRIGHLEWLQLDVLKVDPVGACDLFIQAAATELAIAALNGAVADAVTDRDWPPAGLAGVRRRLDGTHLIPSRRANSAVAAPRSETAPRGFYCGRIFQLRSKKLRNAPFGRPGD